MKFVTSKEVEKLLNQANSRHTQNRLNFESCVHTYGPDHRKTISAVKKMQNSFDIWSKALTLAREVGEYEKALDKMEGNTVLFKSLKERNEIGRTK